MISLRNVIASSVFLFVAASVATADDTPIRHAELGFEFHVPSGYEQLATEELAASEPDLLFAFGRPNADQSASEEVLVIRRLGKVMPRQETPDDIRDADGQLLPTTRMPWKDFDLWATRLEGEVAGRGFMTWVVLVPTSPEAIRVTISGEPARSEELKRQLQEFLMTLDGKSNWLSDQERRDRVTQPIGFVLIVAIVVVLVYLRNRKSRSRTAEGDRLDSPNSSEKST